VARALIVGCGCRGLELAGALRREGWLVRGTTRDRNRLDALERAGIEGAVSDPDRLATILDRIADVTTIYWLLGSATGSAEAVAALHSERLESLLARIVDSPVRGFVYEAAGSVDPDVLRSGAGVVRAAAERWRIPGAVVDEPPAELGRWVEAMAAAAVAGY
jgi:NAD(P)-dependent dehydrogenase (short-subunit alcohol dehydrogenase family)